MKKLLLLIALLICTLCNAQSFTETLNSLDYEQAKLFATEVATGRTTWELVKETNSDRALTFTYVDNAIGSDKVAAIKAGKLLTSGLNTIVVKYTVIFEGEDKNLEKAGIKKYSFFYATGKYLDLFPIWQNKFNKSADLNLTPKEYKMQEFRDSKHLFKFTENTAPNWVLEKH